MPFVFKQLYSFSSRSFQEKYPFTVHRVFAYEHFLEAKVVLDISIQNIYLVSERKNWLWAVIPAILCWNPVIKAGDSCLKRAGMAGEGRFHADNKAKS